jgi:cytochrome c556
MKKTLAMVGLVALGVAAAAQVGVAQTPAPNVDVIAVRQAGYDLLGATVGGVSVGLKANVDVKSFAGSADAISAWAKQIPGLFPPGSDQGHNTKALPAIWSDRAGFEKDAADLGAAADKLETLAKAGDTAGFTDQLKVVGAACGACHRAFRAK